ncbi:MAG: sodium:solute symporter family transporter, partial [Gammaproteobacteria bacterium]
MLIASFIVYLILVAGIGYRAWRQTQTVDDYLLGGRRVGASVAALSAGASDMSGWLLLGLPGLAVLNPTAAGVTALGLLLGTWCNWRFVAARLRQGSAALEALTLPDYFARRFPAHG